MPSGGERCINSPSLSPTSLLAAPLSWITAWGFIILSILQSYWLLFPSPLVIETSQSGAAIYFSSNRSVILFPHDCITIRWNVENINQVYLNDQPQIGSGQTRACLSDSQPALTVHFQDGTQETYVLNIMVLSSSPLPWLTLLLALLTATLRWKKLISLARHPLRIAAALVTLWLLLFVFALYILPLSETIASGNWLDASNAAASIITALTLLAFLLTIAAPIGQNFLLSNQPPADSFRSRHIVFRWALGVIASLVLIAATILAVNPRGMYLSTTYSPYELILRGTKTDDYQRLQQTPDLVIMGSSRAFTISPEHIRAATGLTAYNMAIEGGRIEDFLIQSRQMSPLPQVLFIEVQEGLPRQANDIAARAPLHWLPFMSIDTALRTIEKRLTGLFDLHQFAEAVYTARYYPVYSREPKEWPLFDTDGFASRPLLSSSELEQAVLLDIGRLPPPHCEGIDPASDADVQHLIAIAETQHTALVFYLSPWHPRYYDAVLRDNPDYQSCYLASLDYLHTLSQSHANLFFLDFTHLDSINGLDDQTGYFDSQHITQANSDRLIDHAAETLLRAYHVAQGG
jgi:hypothetical protein